MEIAEVVRFEWLVFLLVPLLLAVRELIGIRRELRRDRERLARGPARSDRHGA